MRTKSHSFAENSLVTLKDQDWFEKQRLAGEAVATCLATSRKLIERKTPNLTLKDIEEECKKIITSFSCTPTFKDYKGFPGAICASVNKQLVHGIPSDYKLKEGDVVKIDLGATFEGVIADAAITAIYGEGKSEHQRLIKACREALYKGIDSIAIGKRLGVIGHSISKYARSHGYALVTRYGGHGLDLNKPHAPPFVANKAHHSEGIRIQPGLTIAIEPMLVMGFTDKTKVGKDGWTVWAKDICAHTEHTLFVGEDKVHIMTDHEGL